MIIIYFLIILLYTTNRKIFRYIVVNLAQLKQFSFLLIIIKICIKKIKFSIYSLRLDDIYTMYESLEIEIS